LSTRTDMVALRWVVSVGLGIVFKTKMRGERSPARARGHAPRRP
jgi:hypothetical protein